MKLIRHLAALALALSTFAAATPQLLAYEPAVGIQSWTCRNMEFDQVVEFAVAHKIKYLQMISKHIDPNGKPEETMRKKAILDSKGLVCYTFGVTGTSMKQEENRKLFEFAKLMGIKVIVVEPRDYRILDLLEELVKEYDIKIAIHNHGIRTLYGNPLVVKTLIDHRDKRIGVCMDVGWIASTGLDVAKVYKDYNGRVYDIHLKDKKIEKTAGDDVYLDVMVGTGQANYKGLFQELKKTEWQGVMAIETDNATFAKDPAEFVAGAIDF
ncbi:MAG TPA: sugar phosphate isomerase/epimerase, partial [Roseimicrobium sp.]|nr:sugar phosphate isomerase/epimerase [Roseimicrobium sp.]